MTTTPETNVIPGPRLIDRLQWRYATKAFDAGRNIPADQWSTIERALVLAPSSYGLQPWRAVVVADPAVRQQLLPLSYGQRQVVDASHLLVLAAKVAPDAAMVDKYVARTAVVRGVPVEKLAGFRQMMVGSIAAKDARGADDWCARQAYLALGVLLTTVANLGIDACPMEGIDPAGYDRVLGLREQGYAATVVTALGYRSPDDRNATMPKVRPEAAELIHHV